MITRPLLLAWSMLSFGCRPSPGSADPALTPLGCPLDSGSGIGDPSGGASSGSTDTDGSDGAGGNGGGGCGCRTQPSGAVPILVILGALVAIRRRSKAAS